MFYYFVTYELAIRGKNMLIVIFVVRELPTLRSEENEEFDLETFGYAAAALTSWTCTKKFFCVFLSSFLGLVY